MDDAIDWRQSLKKYFVAVFGADHIIANPDYLATQCDLDLHPKVMSWIRDLYKEQIKDWFPPLEERRYE